MFHAWIVFGPTATGKTEVAFQLADKHNSNMLSFDSRQIYKDMGIGTGQDIPLGYSQSGDGVFRHKNSSMLELFGFNIIESDKEFSIAHYYKFAKDIIEQHRQQKKPLVLVGGCWPYMKVLIDPPDSLQVPPNASLRQELEGMDARQLKEKLEKVAPNRLASMNESDQNNPRRLVRAIEVALNNQAKVSEPLIGPDEMTMVLHSLPMEQIESNIKFRIDKRLKQGVLEETKALMDKYQDWSQPAFTATGYRYLRDHLLGKIDLDQVKNLWFQQERQYAKRQMTWLKSLLSV